MGLRYIQDVESNRFGDGLDWVATGGRSMEMAPRSLASENVWMVVSFTEIQMLVEQCFVFALAGGLVMGKDHEFKFEHYELPVRHSSAGTQLEDGIMGLDIRAEI